MNCSIAQTTVLQEFGISAWRMFGGFLLIILFAFSVYAQENLSLDNHTKTLTIEEVQDGEVYVFGRNVIVKKGAKGVFAFGGDIIIEGRIEGDVAALGGSIAQKQGAFIGGDVVVIGGTYKYEDSQPQRSEGKETIMFASYEEELRSMTQNPAQLFAPSFSPAFLAQRLLSVLFWFLISLALTTIAPGAISRSVARFQLSAAKILGIGFVGFLIATVGIVIGLTFLPNFLSAVIGLMAFVMLLLAYVFGRVALQVSAGKFILKRFWGDPKYSESIALFIGALFWTALLSLPYLWIFALLVLFVASLGIVLTSRSPNNWQKI